MLDNNRFFILQNGTDVRGVSMEGIGGQKVNFGGSEAFCIAQAFTIWLSKKIKKNAGELKIGVGHDSRLTAELLKNAIIEGLVQGGVQVYDGGLCSTPAMFMTTVYDEFCFDGSIMITASHLPFNRNGMKFFDKDGGLEKEDIKNILSIADKLYRETGGKCEENQEKTAVLKVFQVDIIGTYAEDLVNKIREGVYRGSLKDGKKDITKESGEYLYPLKGMKIVVDAGNGAGGFFVDKVLRPLGAETEGSCFLEPDGTFPNHIPNPEDKTAMESIRNAVVEYGADLGLIFDTDVDRMSGVLSDGRAVNRDAIIAMMASVLSADYPGGTVVTDSVTSDKLTDFIENKLGMKHHRFKRGYKNVINECKRLNAEGVVSPLAIETSGHGALKENYYLDDGAYMAVKLLIAAAISKMQGGQMGDYISGFRQAVFGDEIRIRITREDFGDYGREILRVFEERAEQKGIDVVRPNYEGVRLSFKKGEIRGWLLLRLSLHDPLMPLNMEGESPSDMDKMKNIVLELLEGYDYLEKEVLR